MADPIIAPAVVPSVPAVAPISNTPYPAVMSPTEATQLVSQYGIDPNQVLSSQNIQQTTTAPAPSPDDLLGIRAQIYNEQGVNASQTAYQNALKAASSATLGLNERLTGLRGRAVSINKIVGQQAQERAVSQGEIDALNESARIALSDYAAKKGNADEMFQIRNQEISEKKQIMLQYPGAKITFGDSFTQVTSKLTKYAKDQKKELYKDALKAKAIDLGLKTKGSIKDLEKRISKSNKEALADAKYTANLKNQQILADIANTKSTIANRNKPDKLSATEQYIQDKQDVFSELDKVRGGDGYIDPYDYNRLKSAWSVYNDPSKFDENFQGYINPDDVERINLTKTSAQLIP